MMLGCNLPIACNEVLTMNSNIQQLFDSLSDGLLILNAQGVVRYANPAALPVIACRVDDILPFDKLRQTIDELQKGYLDSPQTLALDIGPAGAPRLIDLTLMSSPVAEEFLLLVHPDDERRDVRNTFTNFIEMLDSSLERPIQKLLGSSERLLDSFARQAGEDFGLNQEIAELRRCADDLRNEIQQISLFASSCSAVTMLSDERIRIPELLAESLAAARPSLLANGIRLCFAGIDDGLPVIYGSKQFLGRALTVYLKHLATELVPNSYMQISAERCGSFIRLVLTDYGEKGPEFPTEITESSFAKQFDSSHSLDLSLPICRRILELHRGRLQVINEKERVHRIIFELPAGTPPVTDVDLGMRQALRYAHDLLLLMKHREAAPSEIFTPVAACAS